MQVKYVGMFDAVDVAEVLDRHGFPVTVKRGELVDVPAEVGVRLLEQADNWTSSESRAERAPKTGGNTEG